MTPGRVTRVAAGFAALVALSPASLPAHVAAPPPNCRPDDPRPACSGEPDEPDPKTHAPEGAITEGRRLDGGRLRVSGWARDPDVSLPILVRILVDGDLVATVSAGGPFDSARRGPLSGAGHQFQAVVSDVATASKVCAVAVNVGPGPGTASLGCRTLPRIRVMTFNVSCGGAGDDRPRPELNRAILTKQAELIAKSDVALLQETCENFDDLAVKEQVKFLAARAGRHYRIGIDSRFPQRGRNASGANAILSRFPMVRATTPSNRRLRDPTAPRLRTVYALHAELVIGQDHLHVFSSHFSNTHAGPEWRVEEVRRFARFMREKVRPGGHVVFGADLNADAQDFPTVHAALAQEGLVHSQGDRWLAQSPSPSTAGTCGPPQKDHLYLTPALLVTRSFCQSQGVEHGVVVLGKERNISDHPVVWADLASPLPAQTRP